MVRNKRTLLAQSYLNKKEIAYLFGIYYKKVDPIFEAAKKLEGDTLNIYPKKVRKSCVLKVMNTTVNQMIKEIELDESCVDSKCKPGNVINLSA